MKRITINMMMAVMMQAAVFGAAYTSPAALVYNGSDYLYVADQTGRRLLEFSLTTHQVARAIDLPMEPTGLMMVPLSNTIYISGGNENGVIMALSLSGVGADMINVGHTPMSPVVYGNLLYACNRFSGTVSVVDTVSKSQVASIPVGREPVAVALTPDGARLVVAHHLPEGAADDNDNVLKVSIIDTSLRTVFKTIKLVNGSSGGRGICISPDGAYAYVTHLVGRYQMPTNQLDRGWMWTNAISVIQIAPGTLVNTVLLDEVYAGAANPWAAACSADGSKLCITHAGSMEVSIINRTGLHQRLTSVAGGTPVPGGFSNSAGDVPNDLGFLADLRTRVQLAGNGPRSLVLAGNQAWVGNYFSESLDTFDITAAEPAVQSYVLGSGQASTAQRLGEQYFNDGNTCYQKWLSCASCHPDARADSLNWDLMNDGMGSPRNGKSMLLSHYSAPAMITGIRANAEMAVTAGFKFIQFMTVEPEEESAVNAYMRLLRPVASPCLVNGDYSDAAKRGRQLFFGKANCGACHRGDLYIDPSAQGDYISENKYDVGTNRPEDTRPLDVPTLAEVWRTAPYLQGGGAATIHDVLTTFNTNDFHGNTSGLTSQELLDLEQFVLSIGKSLYTSDSIRSDIAGPQGEADGKVNNIDFAMLTAEWLEGTNSYIYSRADLAGGTGGSPDYKVDIADLIVIANQWLMMY